MIALLSAWSLVAACAVVFARRALAVRAEGVARAGHDLRAPLTAALLAVSAARRARDGAWAAPLDAAWGSPLDAAEAELLRAGELIGHLVEAGAGHERATQPRSLVDVAALLARQASCWELLAAVRGRGLVVAADCACIVPADAPRVVRATTNLVTNAIEHGAGTVGVTVSRVNGGGVRIEVTDQGGGLPAPIAALVAARRRRPQDRGRGLAIAAEIAEAHGGRLSTAPSAAGARLVLELAAQAPTAWRARLRLARVRAAPVSERAA